MIQWVKYKPKTGKKTFSLSKPKSELMKKKRDSKSFLISEWFKFFV